MKKILWMVLLGMIINQTAHADGVDGRTAEAPMARMGHALGRGSLNAITLISELYFTPRREALDHTRLWPVTMVPRTINNVFVRAASAGYDVVFHPFIVPFTDDLSPVTEPMGLPEYPWGEPA